MFHGDACAFAIYSGVELDHVGLNWRADSPSELLITILSHVHLRIFEIALFHAAAIFLYRNGGILCDDGSGSWRVQPKSWCFRESGSDCICTDRSHASAHTTWTPNNALPPRLYLLSVDKSSGFQCREDSRPLCPHSYQAGYRVLRPGRRHTS